MSAPRKFPTLRWASAAIGGERARFVVVSAAVNLLMLARAYVFMRALDFAELGVVAVTQSIVLLISACQFGVLNGGYRLICAEDDAGIRRITNQVYTLFGLLAFGIIALTGALLVFAHDRQQEWALVAGAAAGLLGIVRTWMINHMTAALSLRLLNRINLFSTLLSLAVLVALPLSPLAVCLISILAQPMAFAVGALVAEPRMRPGALLWSTPLVRRLLASGFLVFLAGIFVQINGQLERWSIVASSGTAGLGHFYLALLFVNLYTMVPTSLDALYLPRLVRARLGSVPGAVRGDLGKFFAITLAYSCCVTGATLVVAQPLVAMLLPKYLPDLRYVYQLLPGLFVLGLTAPLAIVFNVLIQYRFYFLAYGLGTLCTAGLLGLGFLVHGRVTLDQVAGIKTLANLAMALVILLGYAWICRRFPEFAFGARRRPGQPAR